MSAVQTTSTTPISEIGTPEIRSRKRTVLRQFFANPGAAVGTAVFALVVLVAIVGRFLTPYDPLAISTGDQMAPPSLAHPLGADQFGRDVLTRILYGAPLSLEIGFVSIAFAVVLGLLFGLPAGFFGGAVDMVVMRGVDMLMAFPTILLALGIVAILGPSLTNAMIAVGISEVPIYVRLIRATTLAARELPYVESAKVAGCSSLRIIARHILPNIGAPLIVLATLGIATAIIVGAALSFLGLGAQPPTPEWGAMLTEGRNFIRVAWWLTTFPGAAIMLTVLAINLIGDGLRDALDPRMKL